MSPLERGARRLPRAARMRKAPEFRRCQFKGKRYPGERVILMYWAQEIGPARLGIVVRKSVGNAVVRNRWKRVIRETFRHAQAGGKSPGDHLVEVRRGVSGPPGEEAVSELRKLLGRI